MRRPFDFRSSFFSSLGLLLVSAGSGIGATLLVPAEYPTIQAGIDAAVDGDVVLVAPGTYRGDGNRDIRFHGKDLRVLGEGGASVTIIDPEQTNRGFTLEGSDEPISASIEGFTIRNGRSRWLPVGSWDGGGILIYDSRASIRNCIIEDCESEIAGGGVYVRTDGPVTIEGCTIRGNIAHADPDVSGRGGGLAVQGPVTVVDCTIEDNVAVTSVLSGGPRGGGVLATGGASIERCHIAGNEAIGWDSLAGQGGGVAGSDFTVRSSYIQGNSADLGGGISSSGSLCRAESCVITGNFAVQGGGLVANSGVLEVLTSTVTSNRVDTSSFEETPRGGGLAALSGAQVLLDATILWGNCAPTGDSGAFVESGGSLGLACCAWELALLEGAGDVSTDEESFDADPLFCLPLDCGAAPSADGDYSLHADSPCLPGGNGCGVRIGAETEGCGATPVREASWGGIKAMFR